MDVNSLGVRPLIWPNAWLKALSESYPNAWPRAESRISDLLGHALLVADLMATMSHNDWLSRRQRQKQGIQRAHTLGKYRGKQADQERHQNVLYYRQVKKLCIRETADYSISQICRIQALHKNNESS